MIQKKRVRQSQSSERIDPGAAFEQVSSVQEDRVLELERQLRESQAVAKIGSWELDLRTGRLSWSEQIYVIFGLVPDEFPATYEGFLNTVHPEDRDAVNRAYTRSVEEKSEYRIIHRLLLKDGRIKYVEERGRTIYDEAGTPLRSMGTVQDISELHTAEMALRTANARLREEVDDQGALLRHITQNSPDEIIVIDDAGRILFANRSPAGTSLRELTGTSLFRQIPAESLPAFKDCVVRALANGEATELELCFRSPPRQGHFLIRITRIPQGTRLLVLMTDITVRKSAEEGVRRQDALRRAVEKLALVASWEWSEAEGDLVSPDMAALLHSKSPVRAVSEIGAYLAEEDRLSLAAALERLRISGTSFDLEVETTASYGRRMFLRITGTSEGGRIFGYVQDITDRKSSEVMILSWFAELRALQRALEESAIVSVTSLDGTILDVNDHFCRSSGYTREELIGRPHRIVNSGFHSKEFWSTMWETIRAGKTWRAEVRNRARDGTIYWVDTVINPIHNEHGEIVKYLSIRNLITDRKRTEEALIQAREEAERANIEKSNFLARMSHEIRTPMNAIMGLASILQSSALREEDLEKVRGIHSSASSLLRIINDILDYSRIEAGKIELVHSIFSVRDVIVEALQVVTPRPGVDIRVEMEDSVPSHIEHDPVRVRQILINLAGNAVKFTERGSVTVRCKLLSRSGADVTIEFCVEDTGIGIAPEDLGRLFKPYVQGDLTRRRRFEGTGLGLAISSELAAMMGGSLTAESTPGQGAKFCFTLKAKAQAAPAGAEAPPAQPDRELASRFPLKILIVDDNHLNRVVALAYLSAFGYSAASVESGAEAIEIARTTRFDLIFMDVHMPEMDGLTAAERILRQNPWPLRPFIVALTADALAGGAEVMDGWLLKPMSVGELQQVLRRFGRLCQERGIIS